MLQDTLKVLNESDFSLDNLTKQLNDLLSKSGQKPAVYFSLIRIATSWTEASPNLAATLNVLGKERSINRIQKAIEILK